MADAFNNIRARQSYASWVYICLQLLNSASPKSSKPLSTMSAARELTNFADKSTRL